MNLETAINAINAIGLKTIGVPNIFGDRMIPYADLVGRFETLGSFDLNPAFCGPMAALITKLSVRVKVGIGSKKADDIPRVYVRFEYAYTHENGGRNGYDLEASQLLDQVNA